MGNGWDKRWSREFDKTTSLFARVYKWCTKATCTPFAYPGVQACTHFHWTPSMYTFCTPKKDESVNSNCKTQHFRFLIGPFKIDDGKRRTTAHSNFVKMLFGAPNFLVMFWWLDGGAPRLHPSQWERSPSSNLFPTKPNQPEAPKETSSFASLSSFPTLYRLHDDCSFNVNLIFSIHREFVEFFQLRVNKFGL